MEERIHKAFKNLKNISRKNAILSVVGFVIVVMGGYFYKYPITDSGKLEICADYQSWKPYETKYVNKTIDTHLAQGFVEKRTAKREEEKSKKIFNNVTGFLELSVDHKVFNSEYEKKWQICELELKKFPQLFRSKYKTKMWSSEVKINWTE